MFSNEVAEVLAQIDAAAEVLLGLDLTDFAVDDLVRLAGSVEFLSRRQAVLRGDLAHELGRREVGEIGRAAHRVLADWLRISLAEARRRARLAEPLARRTALRASPCRRDSPRPPRRGAQANSMSNMSR